MRLGPAYVPASQKYLMFQDTERSILEFCYNVIYYNSEFSVRSIPDVIQIGFIMKDPFVDFCLTFAHLKHGNKEFLQATRGSYRISLILVMWFSLCKCWLRAIKFSKDRKKEKEKKKNYSLCFLYYWTAHLLKNKFSHTGVIQIRFGDPTL